MKTRNYEDALVARIRRNFGSPGCKWLPLTFGDDAALFRPRRGFETILTCDWFLEGSHFLRAKHPPECVGWKCLARATSDIAAMGGVPRCFLLSLALPRALTGSWLDDFLGGLRHASRTLGCPLAGGDTTRGGQVLISVTVIGEARQGRGVLRSGARPDDLIFVSGGLGGADLGLSKLLRQRGMANAKDKLLQRHLHPEPRLALGQWLADSRLATAMIDLSDGLSTDLGRLCEASGVGAVIGEGALPALKGVPEAKGMRLALHGGDDYELLFTVKPDRVRRLPKNFRGLPISCIGAITRKKQVLLVKDGGATEELLPGGWDPFRQ